MEKVIICPKCGEEIDCFNYKNATYNYGSLDINGTFDDCTQGDTEDNRSVEFGCPGCNEVVATSDEEALEVLKKSIKEA